MKRSKDSIYATRMLETRKRGFTWRLFLRRSARSLFLLLGTFALLLPMLNYIEAHRAFYLMLGMLGGALLRDLGWFRRIRQSWPFTNRITDWEKVEKLAVGESSADSNQAASAN